MKNAKVKPTDTYWIMAKMYAGDGCNIHWIWSSHKTLGGAKRRFPEWQEDVEYRIEPINWEYEMDMADVKTKKELIEYWGEE